MHIPRSNNSTTWGKSMVDFHTHVLPQMDDGSQSVQESMQMLHVSALQGVTTLIATPHFYARENDICTFLKRRSRAVSQLISAWTETRPRLLLGAEVHYFEGISQANDLICLRIENSELLLLEMPFDQWEDWMVREVIALNAYKGVTVVLAHIERYFQFQNSPAINRLLASGVLMQANAAFLLQRNTRKKALQMLENGQIHCLGSDCHNMTLRPPCLLQAIEFLRQNWSAQETAAFLRRQNAYLTIGSRKEVKL